MSTQQRKILVIGDNSLAYSIANIFTSHCEWQVFIVASGKRQLNNSSSAIADSLLSFRNVALNDINQLEKLFEELKPHTVIHCVEEHDLDVCENFKTQAELLNVKIVENVAVVSKKYSSWMLFISSSYVFDGIHPPYTSNAQTNPLQEYGRQKLEAERTIWKIAPDAGVLRVPYYLYSRDLNSSANILAQLKRIILEGKTTSLDDWQKIYPTSTDEIAMVCLGLVKRKVEHCGLYGTWHWSSKQQYTMYSLAVEIATLIGASHSHLIPISEPHSSRKVPENPQLNPIVLEVMAVIPDEFHAPSIADVVLV